jgi:hypothetical protein
MFRGKLLALAVLCSLTVVLPAHAQKQAGPAAPACQPDIKPGMSDCDLCKEKSCCVERRACNDDPACTAFVTCRRSGCASPPCTGKCGAPPPAYVDLFVCRMTKCNTDVCGTPVDACTLCQATRCGAAFLTCQNVVGCDAYSSCVNACKGDAACVKKCKAASPEAIKTSEAQFSCYKKECSQACP